MCSNVKVVLLLQVVTRRVQWNIHSWPCPKLNCGMIIDSNKILYELQSAKFICICGKATLSCVPSSGQLLLMKQVASHCNLNGQEICFFFVSGAKQRKAVRKNQTGHNLLCRPKNHTSHASIIIIM